MIRESWTINETQFKEHFEKSFTSFCEKSPLVLSYKLAGDLVVVEDESGLMEDEFLYTLDFLKDVKVNIADIKDHLMKYYPVFYDKVEKTFTVEQVKEMMKQGIGYEDIMNRDKEYEEIPRYQIIRVINQYNEINVWDIQERKTKFYKLSIPVITFMDTVYDDPVKGYELFKSKSKKIGH